MHLGEKLLTHIRSCQLCRERISLACSGNTPTAAIRISNRKELLRRAKDDTITEVRGKDYPIFSGAVKMEICMTRTERRKWFCDRAIALWRKANPNGEKQGAI